MNALVFFFVVAGPRAINYVVASMLMSFGCYLAQLAPDTLDQTLGMALFLQLFAASTGYRDRLRRGQFDPVLVPRRHPAIVAASHWLVSVGLGVAVWIVLGLTDLIAHLGKSLPTAFTPGALVAFLYASTAVWTISLPLGRYAGGMLWLASVFVLASTQQIHVLRLAFISSSLAWTDVLRATVAELAFPILLLFEPRSNATPIIVLTLLAAAVVWLLGMAMVARFDAVLAED